MAELDELAERAATLALPVNGLDPTAFTSVPAMERDLISFAKKMLGASTGKATRKVQGSITSGGTESCMLAVKTARDLWRSKHPELVPVTTPRIVAPQTVHAAFQKAAHYFDMHFDAVPVDKDGVVDAEDVIERLGPDVAIVVVSAPSYPTAQLDPVREVAAATKLQGISCHVDACIGGFALPWLKNLTPWNFSVDGVTSISADLHKFGYAPKGASVLLQRGVARHRKQFFATTKWPGYPIVNPTMLGSRSATGLAAAWAVVQRLGDEGYSELTAKAATATNALLETARRITGLRVMGDPVGPLFALCTDESVAPYERVDPHHLADKMAELGFYVQHQPGFKQSNGVKIAHSVHFTITPVTLSRIDELLTALVSAADAVRGLPRAKATAQLTALKGLGLLKPTATLSTRQAGLLLRAMGMGASSSSLPSKMAPLMRVLEELPSQVAESVLIEILARLSQP